MPFDLQRFKRLRQIKNIKQQGLAGLAGVAQSQISECERGTGPTVELLERLATALDCTTDFLLSRSFVGTDSDDSSFRAAVSRMAFDVFAARLNVGIEQKERCRRVLAHSATPLTADCWAILSEQIDLAIGPTNGGTALHVLRGGA
jgi:transcriptional regulator with XRE-family HTH domain